MVVASPAALVMVKLPVPTALLPVAPLVVLDERTRAVASWSTVSCAGRPAGLPPLSSVTDAMLVSLEEATPV